MFNPSSKKNGDYTEAELKVIELTSHDIITTSTPQKNENLDDDGWV